MRNAPPLGEVLGTPGLPSIERRVDVLKGRLPHRDHHRGATISVCCCLCTLSDVLHAEVPVDSDTVVERPPAGTSMTQQRPFLSWCGVQRKAVRLSHHVHLVHTGDHVLTHRQVLRCLLGHGTREEVAGCRGGPAITSLRC